MKRHLTLLLSFFTVTLSLIAGGPKYLFLFIGDGMGAEQINAVQMYINAIQGTEQKLNMLQFPVKGVTKTSAANFFITDSAAAGTAIATGHKTNLGVLGLDPSLNRELETVAERCQTLGMKVGIITTVSADHATPAAFYAHQTSRSHYYEIARQLVESDFNFFGTGSLRYPAGKYDEKENIFDYAQQNGYKLINTQSEYTSFRPEASTEEKIWIISEKIAGDSAIPYSIDNTNTFDIDDITQTAIDFLYNESGFFLMIEAGKVDWACHANDAAAAIHDLLAFDRAIAHAVDFYRKYPEDTLIIVTGDHETGGLKTDFIGTNHISDIRLIQNQLISQEAFTEKLNDLYDNNLLNDFNSDLLPQIERYFGLYATQNHTEKASTPLSEDELLLLKKAFDEFQKFKETGSSEYTSPYGEYNPVAVTCTHILNKKAGLTWSTYTHTGMPVNTYALGNGEALFSGYYENTRIAENIFELLEREGNQEH